MLIKELWIKTSETQENATLSKLKTFSLVEVRPTECKYCYNEITVQKIQNTFIINFSL